jgi:hypothetical protein
MSEWNQYTEAARQWWLSNESAFNAIRVEFALARYKTKDREVVIDRLSDALHRYLHGRMKYVKSSQSITVEYLAVDLVTRAMNEIDYRKWAELVIEYYEKTEYSKIR